MKSLRMQIRRRRFELTLATIIIAVVFVSSLMTRPALMQSDGAAQQAPITQATGRASFRVNEAERKAAGRAGHPDADEVSAASAPAPNTVQNASSYVFTTATNASFTDMSSGTTQLVAAGSDDTASGTTNIGFDFYLLGTRFTSFTASSNGYIRLGGTVSTTQYTLGTAGQTLITAYGSDMILSNSGKVHYKVTGSAPNRVLTVEFLNVTIIYDGIGTSTDGTYEVKLHESTGVVDFVYGAMNRNTGTGFSGANNPQYVGFSTNSTDNTYVTVTTATNTANTTGATASNLPANGAPIANLNTPVDGSRRIYSFAPATPTAPIALNFTAVTPTSYTLNWTDSPDESLYVVYRSTDGITYNFETTLPQNTASYPVSALHSGTTYFWQVYAVSDGAVSTALAGSQATVAGTPNNSLTPGGLWSNPVVWSAGHVPTAAENVTVSDPMTMDTTAATALSVSVGSGGTLTYDTTAARTLTVGEDVTIASGGTFNTGAAGAIATHVLSIGGNLTNNGTLDFSTTGGAANSCAAGITFTGASSNTFGGTGATTDIRTMTINKGTSNANIIELNPTNFTVQGTIVDGAPMAFLTITNGTLKISGTFTLAARTFTAAAYTIPATGGFWLNNPNYTVAGQNGSPTQSGLLRVSQGTFNIGTATGNSMGFSTGSTIIVEGGAVNGTSRFGVAAAGNTITYTQTGGTITVCTIGNASATLGSFDLGTSATTNVNMSGGTIVVPLAATAIDYRYDAGSGPVGLTGGTLQLGNAASGAAKAFNLRGVVPNLVLDGTSAGHSATFSNTLVNYFNVAALNITIGSGTTLNLNGSATSTLFFMDGSTLTNNGTLTATNANKRFYWAGTTAQTYTGTGVVTAPLNSWELDNALGLTLTNTINAVVNRIILFTGSFTNSNKFTLGNGGATSGTIIIGNSGASTAAGTFDVAPTFNLGTAGQILTYNATATSRTTGPEVNPTRSITSFTYNDNDVTHSLTIAGGDFTVTGTATLTNGRIITGANNFILGSAATVARTTGYVDGNLRKTFVAAASKSFEVGTANGYSPVTVNATAGTFPSDFTVKSIQGPNPSVNAASSVQRYWSLSGAGMTADLTFQYLVGDVMGTEANYKVIREIGGTPEAFPTSTVNTGAHTATLTGVSSFSNWTVGEILSPTAAPATISGIVTRADGTPLGGVTVNLSGSKSDRAITDGNGQYRFNSVATEHFYTVAPALSNYSFSPASRSFSLLGNKTDAVFVANANTPSENPVNSADFFVRQQYLDFLGREPDHDGWIFWSNQIATCGPDQNCVRQKRLDVSAAFFMSEEFQRSGDYIYRLYRLGLGRQLTYAEFTDDHKKVIGGAELDAMRTRFAEEFTQRPEFVQRYQNAVLAETFVDALLQGVLADTQLDLSSQREALIATYHGGADQSHSRSAVLQTMADNSAFRTAVYNPSFVLMEYFGYLQRDIDQPGFDFWVNVLSNREPGNYRGMVCSFITSAEYQERFSPVVTRNNGECGR